jgi:hypothetical protein
MLAGAVNAWRATPLRFITGWKTVSPTTSVRPPSCLKPAGIPAFSLQITLAYLCNSLLFKYICFALTIHANSLSRKEKINFSA